MTIKKLREKFKKENPKREAIGYRNRPTKYYLDWLEKLLDSADELLIKIHDPFWDMNRDVIKEYFGGKK